VAKWAFLRFQELGALEIGQPIELRIVENGLAFKLGGLEIDVARKWVPEKLR
jgi:hypothetical protein